jgi:hypothetical protein
VTGIVAAPLLSASTPWYLSRAAGMVSLALLTVSSVLGLLVAARVSTRRWPRFVIEGLHRSSACVAVAFVLAHVTAILFDAYVPIGVLNLVVPFTSATLTIWTGLAAIAFDLLLIVLVSSLLRTRIGPRLWRLLHATTYLIWPVAAMHALGAGSDRPWVVGLVVVGLVAILVAGGVRLTGWRTMALRRPAPLGAPLPLPAAARAATGRALRGGPASGPISTPMEIIDHGGRPAGEPGPGAPQPGRLQPGAPQPGRLQPGGLQPGRLQPGGLQPGAPQSGGHQPGPLPAGRPGGPVTGPGHRR